MTICPSCEGYNCIQTANTEEGRSEWECQDCGLVFYEEPACDMIEDMASSSDQANLAGGPVGLWRSGYACDPEILARTA